MKKTKLKVNDIVVFNAWGLLFVGYIKYKALSGDICVVVNQGAFQYGTFENHHMLKKTELTKIGTMPKYWM